MRRRLPSVCFTRGGIHFAYGATVLAGGRRTLLRPVGEISGRLRAGAGGAVGGVVVVDGVPSLPVRGELAPASATPQCAIIGAVIRSGAALRDVARGGDRWLL